jgi:ribosomal protein L37AE/L43A
MARGTGGSIPPHLHQFQQLLKFPYSMKYDTRGGVKMMKINKIKYCDECGFHRFERINEKHFKCYCCHPNLKYALIICEIKLEQVADECGHIAIPSWCKLEDFKEEKEN